MQQNYFQNDVLRRENLFPQFNVASYKRPGIRLSFEYATTLLLGEGEEGRTGTATMFRKMHSKYIIFSTVLSKIVGQELGEGRGGGWWPIKKNVAASEVIKASAKGQEEVVS